MKRFVFLILLTLGIAFSVNAAKQLSEKSKVVLFTCGPGAELYAGFGHSALWVSDPTTKTDRLYNYGTFDFNTPNFYSKFARGQLDYMLSVTHIQRFLSEYNYRKIEVEGQTLNLNKAEIQKLYELLEKNLKPENRFYRYDFFYDNCATRLWDIVEEATDNQLNLNMEAPNQSFREVLFPYLEHKPWVKFGINLVLGLAADKDMTAKESMYLPDYLQEGFATASLNDGRRLVKSEKEYLPKRIEFAAKWFYHPVTVFTLLLIAIAFITLREIKKGKYYAWLDSILMSIGVLGGVFILFMWFGTDHSATNYNLNFLWMLPAQLVFLINRKSKTYIKFSLIYSLAIIFAMLIWPQKIELSFVLLALLFSIRFYGAYSRAK